MCNRIKHTSEKPDAIKVQRHFSKTSTAFEPCQHEQRQQNDQQQQPASHCSRAESAANTASCLLLLLSSFVLSSMDAFHAEHAEQPLAESAVAG